MSRATTPSPNSTDRLAHVDETLVKDFTDSGSYTRGRTYFRQGHIHDTVLRDRTLTALCDGSDYEPYRVEVTLGLRGEPEGAILDYRCTCPRGGFCKHIVAMLLAWIDDPSQFAALPPLAEALANRSRDELVTLVVQMVRRHPDLERILELLSPPAADQADTPANVATQDPSTIRRHARAGLKNFTTYAYEWGHMPTVSPELENLVELGKGHVATGRWADAQVVFTGIAEEVADIVLEVQDDEGELLGVLSACDEGLAACLNAQADLPEGERLGAEQRQRLIRTAYDIWRIDVIDVGGTGSVGAGIDAIGRAATTTERAMVEGWLDAEKADGDWAARAVITVRVILREQDPEGGLGGEEMLKLYREAELWEDVATVLLDLDRVDEAIALARSHLRQAHVLTTFANALITKGKDHALTAVSLVEDFAWEVEKREPYADAILQQWLIATYARLGQREAALTLAEKRFMRNPDLQNWRAVREVATAKGQATGTWTGLRAKLAAHLRARKGWSILVEAELEEGDVAAALESYDQLASLPKAKQWLGSGLGMGLLRPNLAAAAEQDFPDRAVALYGAEAEALIAARNRDSYRSAAGYLAKAMKILKQQGRGGEWTELIGTIRADHTNLPALRDELDKHGLK